MNETLKSTTVDQLPTADKLDGLFVFAYDGSKAVGKRSVKAPITLLKGNTGATGAAGKDGKDGEVTAAQLEEALTSDKNIATEVANGLLSKEHYKILADMEQNFDALVEAVIGKKYDFTAIIGCNNTQAMESNIKIAFGGQADIDLKVKGKHFEKRGISQPAQLTFPLISENEVLTINANGVNRLTVYGEGANEVQSLALASNIHIQYLSIQALSAKNLDLTALTMLPSLSCQYIGIDYLNLDSNTSLTSLYYRVSSLTSCRVGSAILQSIDLSDNTKLATIIFAKNLTSLKTFNIKNTVITRDILMNNIEPKWDSRATTTTGSLTISKTLYDLLSTEDKQKFIDKNITLLY